MRLFVQQRTDSLKRKTPLHGAFFVGGMNVDRLQSGQSSPEKSDRQLAKAIGVNHETVGAQRKELESTGGIRQLDRTVGADGKERPRQVERKAAEPAQRPSSITVAKPEGHGRKKRADKIYHLNRADRA